MVSSAWMRSAAKTWSRQRLGQVLADLCASGCRRSMGRSKAPDRRCARATNAPAAAGAPACAARTPAPAAASCAAVSACAPFSSRSASCSSNEPPRSEDCPNCSCCSFLIVSLSFSISGRRRSELDLRHGKISSSPHLTPPDDRELIFLGLVDLELLPAADAETTPSVPWFPAI